MVHKLIEKVLEEAQGKGENILEDARKKLEGLWAEKERCIEKEYEEKLKDAQAGIENKLNAELVNYRLEKEKELLAAKNGFIEDVFAKAKERFDRYLSEHFDEVVKSALDDLDFDTCTVRIPQDAGFRADAKYSGKITVEKDPDRKNSFLLQTDNWEFDFSWDSLELTFRDEVVQIIQRSLFSWEKQKN